MLGVPDALGLALARVRDTARTVQSDLKPPPGQEADGARQVARAAVDEVHENAERILEERELDVVWLNRDPRRGPGAAGRADERGGARARQGLRATAPSS